MNNIYDIVTDQIIGRLKDGVIPWQQPWVTVGGAYNYYTGHHYSLLNQMLLGRPGGYLTFRQADAFGGIVKGAKSHLVVFWKIIEDQNDAADKTPEISNDRDTEIKNKPTFVLRYYRVFHQSDVRNLQDVPIRKSYEWESPIDAQMLLSSYLKAEHVNFEEQISDHAYYAPAKDKIHLPAPEQFQQPASYYATAFHESVHSTGHVSRLNRSGLKHPSYGTCEYSYEELIAELGSSMLLHTVGLGSENELDQSSAYIAGWLSVLKTDSRAIVRASKEAQRAVEFILETSGYVLSDEVTHYPVAAD